MTHLPGFDHPSDRRSPQVRSTPASPPAAPSDVHAPPRHPKILGKFLNFRIVWKTPEKTKVIWPAAHGFTGFVSRVNNGD